MKKIIIFVLIFVSLISSLTIYKVRNNSKYNLNSKVVYIESLNDLEIISGFGFVYKTYNDKNYILTNYHVVNYFDNIYVYNGENKTKAELLYFDEYTDIAILTIPDKLGLSNANIGNSNKINIKDNIFIIDSTNEINYGQILNKKDTVTIDNIMMDTIKLNIKINYGYSGSPVFNENGEVMGMIFAMDKDAPNIAFALPINYVMDIVNSLETNTLNRPNLGASMVNATNTSLLEENKINITRENGIVILDIDKNGALDKAGLKKGDIISKINNKEVNNISELRYQLYKYCIGDTISISYYRDQIYYETDVKL